MNMFTSLRTAIEGRWSVARPAVRLSIGILVVILIGLIGMTPKAIFGVPVAWPYIGIIAAVGWGRSGLAFGPMIALVLFGFVQDSSQAPWGAHGLANLAAYGFTAGLAKIAENDSQSAFGFAIPILGLVVGVFSVWVLASASAGALAKVLPLLAALMVSILVHILIHPVFDLVQRGSVSRRVSL